MSEARDIELVNELRAHTTEKEWLEFKTNNTDPQMIGKYCSALAFAFTASRLHFEKWV